MPLVCTLATVAVFLAFTISQGPPLELWRHTRHKAVCTRVSRPPDSPFGPDGTWVWVDRGSESTAICARVGNGPIRRLVVIGGEDLCRVDCGYCSSPDGRWLLIWWNAEPTGETHWLLWDRLVDGFRPLYLPTSTCGFSDPVWISNYTFLLENMVYHQGRDGGLQFEVWKCDTSGYFERIRVLSKDLNYPPDADGEYYPRFDPSMQPQLACLRRLGDTRLSVPPMAGMPYDPLDDLIAARQNATGQDGSKDGALCLPGGRAFVRFDFDESQRSLALRAVTAARPAAVSARMVVKNSGQLLMSGIHPLDSQRLYFTCLFYAGNAYRAAPGNSRTRVPIADLQECALAAPRPTAAETWLWDIGTGRRTLVATGREDALYLPAVSLAVPLPPGPVRVYWTSEPNQGQYRRLGVFPSASAALGSLSRPSGPWADLRTSGKWFILAEYDRSGGHCFPVKWTNAGLRLSRDYLREPPGAGDISLDYQHAR